ncbi:MAG: inner membrane CreD family protein [Verrucomicrobia bacterium]|nr:inner membrane CreD family protein [Verrucomicrobiota bacterium]
MQPTPPELPPVPGLRPTKTDRRNRATLKLLFIAALVLLLQLPLHLVSSLQQERRTTRASGGNQPEAAAAADARAGGRSSTPTATEQASTEGVFEAYRMVERALKHSVLVTALVFAAFFLFETLAGLRLHPVHYGLVGAALGLFYLALLALGEVVAPGAAYVGAALASSALVTLYSAPILKSRARAGVIGALLASVHSVLYVVLRMENCLAAQRGELAWPPELESNDDVATKQPVSGRSLERRGAAKPARLLG